MSKKQLANTETDKNVDEFIANISNRRRREDAVWLLSLIHEETGLTPKIWGVSIVGFGKYTYKRKNGEEYEWFHVGFSPASKHTTLYVMFDLEQEKGLLNKLGPCSNGKGCLYIKNLQEVDEKILRQLIRKSDKWER